jgi:hypothetical protein
MGHYHGIGFNRHRDYGGETTTEKPKRKRYYDDDYYDNDYYSNFNWGNYGRDYSFSEDNDDLYIKNHPNYFTPTYTDIYWRIGHVVNTMENRNLIKEMSRFFYYKILGDKNYFEDKYEDLTKLSESDIVTLSAKKKFYDELWDKFIPGMSPLEKALSVFGELKRTQGERKVYEADSLERVLDNLNFNSDLYADPLLNEILDVNDHTKKNKTSILNKLALIKNLGSEFKVEKEIEEKVVDNSRIRVPKIMKDFSQINNIELYQRLMPNFNLKLLTKDVSVTVPVDRNEHKQKIIILLDYSGSMNNIEKQEWVVAIMVDRLRYAMKEEAEIYFSYFLHTPLGLKFTHIYNRQTAIEFWSKFSTRPSGGDTELGYIVDYLGKQIREGRGLGDLDVDLSKDQPEILAINDGNDTVGVDEFTYKTNALSLFQNNDELNDLCVMNGGKYVVVESNHLTMYNKEGKEVVKY